jgi:molecular chaperone DnaK
MVKDAEAHASEDKERREAVETRNRLDSLIYQTEKNLEDWKEQLDEQGRQEIEGKLESGREALKQGDLDQMRSATEAIQTTVQQAAQQIYAAAGMGEQAAEAPGAAGAETDMGSEEADDDVVEADYEIVEEPETS